MEILMHIGIGILSRDHRSGRERRGAFHAATNNCTAAIVGHRANGRNKPRRVWLAFSRRRSDKELKFAVQFPPSYEADAKRRYPVLYFLHGMFGNEREFERRGVAAAISKMRDEGKIGEFIIVSPAGENSFYLNAKNGAQYEDAIIKDLIPYVEKTYRVIEHAARLERFRGSRWAVGARCFWRSSIPRCFRRVTTHSAALFAELPHPTGADRRSQFMIAIDRQDLRRSSRRRVFSDPSIRCSSPKQTPPR